MDSLSSLTLTETTHNTAKEKQRIEFQDSLADMYREQCIQVWTWKRRDQEIFMNDNSYPHCTEDRTITDEFRGFQP